MSETRTVVAECHTCTCTEVWALEGIKRPNTPMTLFSSSLWNEITRHKAAGHDVREVTR